MKTTFVTPKIYADAALEIVRTNRLVGNKKPEHFKKVMRENRGLVDLINPFGPAGDGLERRNPLIAAFGDSVTAGHFEGIGDQPAFFEKAHAGKLEESDVVEVTDVRQSYPEQFRNLLIDRYEQTSLSVINSGIAGDTLHGMKRRIYRDVIRYQPDLVLVNGSLNWGIECGDTMVYKKLLIEIVRILKNETGADLVLMTPNMKITPPWGSDNPYSPLEERVEVIRETAMKEDTCLADAYRAWEIYQGLGLPIQALLANGTNHPSVTGHELFARILMQLMDE